MFYQFLLCVFLYGIRRKKGTTEVRDTMVKMVMTRASRGDGSEVLSGTTQPTSKIALTASENTSLQINTHKINGKISVE